MFTELKDYLFYVRYSLSGISVYHCFTADPFHVSGELHYRSIEHIERIDFVEQADFRLDYLKEKGLVIHEWKNKYDKKK